MGINMYSNMFSNEASEGRGDVEPVEELTDILTFQHDETNDKQLKDIFRIGCISFTICQYKSTIKLYIMCECQTLSTINKQNLKNRVRMNSIIPSNVFHHINSMFIIKCLSSNVYQLFFITLTQCISSNIFHQMFIIKCFPSNQLIVQYKCLS